jgi:hypothetical protein
MIAGINNETQKKYYEYIYLAEFYRWSVKFGATGNRSPIGGQQYKSNADLAHHQAQKQGYKAIASTYLKYARKLRLTTKNILPLQSI